MGCSFSMLDKHSLRSGQRNHDKSRKPGKLDSEVQCSFTFSWNGVATIWYSDTDEPMEQKECALMAKTVMDITRKYLMASWYLSKGNQHLERVRNCKQSKTPLMMPTYRVSAVQFKTLWS